LTGGGETKDGFVTHKRVDRKLQQASTRMEKRRLAGEKGAKSRWQSYSNEKET